MPLQSPDPRPGCRCMLKRNMVAAKMNPLFRGAAAVLLAMAGIGLHGQDLNYIPRIYIEAGAGINFSYCDVGGGSPGPSVRAAFLYDLAPEWRLGVNVGFHHLRGTDDGTANEARMYAYRSNLNEISAKGVYVFKFKLYPVKKWKLRLEPRIWSGLGVIQFQPKPNEVLASASRDAYLPVAPVFSGGAGLAFTFDREMALLLEAGSNLTTSDFLEGYTNHNFSESRDMFHSILLKFVYFVPVGW